MVTRLVIPSLLALTAAVQAQSAQPQAQPQEADRPTAEDVLRELQKRRPPNDVIPPGSWEGKQAPVEAPVLLPEGTSVVGRLGRLEKDGDWWTFLFEQEPDAPPDPFAPRVDRVKLLPNSTLEGLVRMTFAASGSMRFAVSGEATVFRGENYLLPRGATRAPSGPSPRSGGGAVDDQLPENPKGEDTPAPRDGQAPAQPGGEAAPAEPRLSHGESRAEPVAADASAEDVLEKMKQLAPAAPMEAPRSPVQDDDFSPTAAPIFEGTPIIRRTGRIVPQGEWWAFAVDSAGPEQADAQLRLLPNQSLQFMVDLYEVSPAGLVFTISGEVTEFSGRNYLLARAVTRRLDLGNLRP